MSLREQTQHETRQTYVFYDQHQRPYFANVDTRCRPHLAPCTPLQPQGWTAPIMPDGDLIRPDPVRLGSLIIDYDKWEERAQIGVNIYAQMERMVAEKMFGDQAAEAIGRRDARLLAEIGPPPPAVAFVRAARAGTNKWVLGLDPVMPKWAEAFKDTLPQYRPLALLREEEGPSAFPNADEEEGEPVRRGPGRPRKESTEAVAA